MVYLENKYHVTSEALQVFIKYRTKESILVTVTKPSSLIYTPTREHSQTHTTTSRRVCVSVCINCLNC